MLGRWKLIRIALGCIALPVFAAAWWIGLALMLLLLAAESEVM